MTDESEIRYETRDCRFCRRATEHLIEPWDHGMHGGKAICSTPGCPGFVWLPKNPEDKTRRPSAHKDLVAKYGRGFCELCLRWKDELRPSETLMGHHLVPFVANGEASRENVWILCTACHSLIHWQRVFHGHKELPSREADV